MERLDISNIRLTDSNAFYRDYLNYSINSTIFNTDHLMFLIVIITNIQKLKKKKNKTPWVET